MRFTVAVSSMSRSALASAAIVALAAALCLPSIAAANVTIKDRTVNEPLVLDQNEDYVLDKVYISGVTDVAALTLTGKINSVNLAHCVFSNVWAGMNGKAIAAEAQGAIVGSFVATDTAFEDAQHQLLCLREGAFGTVTFQRCKFRTSDSFLKKIYASDPWRTAPPTTEFANIDRLELLDNEYVNTTLVIHPSVKVVIFRGDMTNVRLQSPSTHVIRLEKGQEPSIIPLDNTAVAAAKAKASAAAANVPAEVTQTVEYVTDVFEPAAEEAPIVLFGPLEESDDAAVVVAPVNVPATAEQKGISVGR